MRDLFFSFQHCAGELHDHPPGYHDIGRGDDSKIGDWSHSELEIFKFSNLHGRPRTGDDSYQVEL